MLNIQASGGNRGVGIAGTYWQVSGSSRTTGERSADFEEEIFLVAVPVSATFNDLDGVVDVLDNAGIERTPATGRQALPIALQTLGEQCQSGNPALPGLLEPPLVGLLCRGGFAAEAQLFQFVAQRVDA
ncbi:hypothetical protein QFZ94_009004 [Paraburkholderia sp. JPY465]